MSKIEIHKKSITKLSTDAVVNAANSGLRQGSGVCGLIFDAAGPEELSKACKAIGHCDEGSAVITPAFALKNNRYIIHAVGPKYVDGRHGEPERLYSCYQKSLSLAKEYNCRSIGFPLISSGVFGYPKKAAWEIALTACSDFIAANPEYDIDITFVGIDRDVLDLGKDVLTRLQYEKSAENTDAEQQFLFFWKTGEPDGYLSNWYKSRFTVEGIEYWCVEQYMMAKKALLFEDLAVYAQIMHSSAQAEIKALGRQVRNFDSDTWSYAKEDVVYNACSAKFRQNPELKEKLLATKGKILAEASPADVVWGIGMAADHADVNNPMKWQGKNLLGKVLMKVRDDIGNRAD